MKILDYIEKEKIRLGNDYNQKTFSEQMLGAYKNRQGYISKIARFECIPSLMMSLVFEILSEGEIRPKDLVTVEQLEEHFDKREIRLIEFLTAPSIRREVLRQKIKDYKSI